MIWDRSFSVGVEEIDAQHKIVFNIINKLIRLKNLEPHSEVISEILTQLREYSEFHFKLEESYMEEIGFDDLDGHILLHNEYKIRLADFSMGVMESRSTLYDDLINFLSEWWLNHILTFDAQYAEAPQCNKSR